MNKEAKSILFLSIFALILTSIALYFASAVSFTVAPISFEANQSLSKLYNFTINNTNATSNIVQVNISINTPAIQIGTNGTSTFADVIVGNNSMSSSFLSWTNSTGILLPAAGGIGNFWFYANFGGYGSVNFTIDVLDDSANVNETNITVVIYPDIPTITLITPQNAANSSSSQFLFNCTASTANSPIQSMTLFIWNSSNVIINQTDKAGVPPFGMSADHPLNVDLVNDGNYKWTCQACVMMGICLNATANRTLTVDSIYPLLSVSRSSGKNWIFINYTAYDLNLKLINSTLYNSSGIYNSSWAASSGPTYTNALNYTNLPDGSYNLTTFAVDSISHINITSEIFTMDSTSPKIGYIQPTTNYPPVISNHQVYVTVNVSDTNQLTNVFIYLYNSTALVANASNTSIAPATAAVLYANFTDSITTDGIYFFNSTTCDTYNNCNSTATINFTVDTIAPQIISAITTDADIFYSTYDKWLNISVNASDATALTVRANLTNLSNTLDCGNGANSILNLTLSNGLYKGSCDISSAISSVTQPEVRAIMITAVDSAMPPVNQNMTGLMFLVHNMGVPPGPVGCARFGNQTTNFTKVLDFAHVNFIIQMEMNGSCLPGQPWTGYEQIMKMNFTSLNMANQSIGQKLEGLKDAIQVNITNPRSFGASRIYVNESAFSELNSNVTVTLGNLPFATKPALIGDNASRSISNIIWTNKSAFNISITGAGICSSNVVCATYNGAPGEPTAGCTAKMPVCYWDGMAGTCNTNATTTYCSQYNNDHPNCLADSKCGTYSSASNRTILIPRGDLTFSVEGFSGYNASDMAAPLVVINNPTMNQKSSSVLANITVNGTITQPSLIIISLNGVTQGIYNATGLGEPTNTANCTAKEAGSEIFDCLLPLTLSDSASYTLAVNVYDFGGLSESGPGNTNSSSKTFSVDTVAPLLNLMSPANNAYSNSSSMTFMFNATDATTGIDCNIIIDDVYNVTSINMTSVVNISTVAGFSSTVHNWSVDCYDNSGENGNTNISETRIFTVDTTLPVAVLSYPAANSNQTSKTILINTSITETNLNYTRIALYDTADIGTVVNITINTTSKSINTSLSVPVDGKYAIIVTVGDLAGNSNSTYRNLTIDSSAPSMTTTSSYPASGSAYSSLQVYEFNVTVIDQPAGVGVQRVIMTFNGTNYTMSNAGGTAGGNIYTNQSSIVGLAAGTYSYSFWYNDSLGNAQPSGSYSYIVTQATPVINLTSSAGWTIDQFTATTFVCAADNSEANVSLYNDTALLNTSATPVTYTQTFSVIGGFTITCNRTSSQNYTANANVSTLTVTPDMPPQYSALSTSVVSGSAYSSGQAYIFNVTWTDGKNVTGVIFSNNFNGTWVNISLTSIGNGKYNYTKSGLAAGTYSYMWIANDTVPQFNDTGVLTYVVAQVTSSCSLAFNVSSPQTYGTSINATCSCTNAEASALLFRDGTNVNTAENGKSALLSAKTSYIYVCNTSATQNYTTAANTSTFTINQATPTLTLTNYTPLTVTYPNGINATGSGCPSQLTCTLYKNGANLSGSSDKGNYSAGSYTYIYNTTGNENYTSASSSALAFTINQATSDLRLYINYSRAGISIPINTALLINATLAAGTGAIQIYSNGAPVYSGTTPYEGNLTNFTNPITYIITANYSSNSNYTTDFETWLVSAYNPTYSSGANGSGSTSVINQTQIIINNMTLLQNITIPQSSNQTVVLDLAPLINNSNVTIGSTDVIAVRTDNSSGSNYTFIIPANTNVSGAAGWDGKIILPIINTSTFTAPSSGTSPVVIEMGSSVELNFSNPVKIIISGVGSGKKAAWSRGDSTLRDISTQCTNATTPGITSGECYYNEGNDLIIWTYHFTSFAAYTPAVTPPTTTPPSVGTAGGCQTTWTCGDWGACTVNETQKRTCYKVAEACYAPEMDKPYETRPCVYTETAVSNQTTTTPSAEEQKKAAEEAQEKAAATVTWVIVAAIVVVALIALATYLMKKKRRF